jgi:hypothetical protein
MRAAVRRYADLKLVDVAGELADGSARNRQAGIRASGPATGSAQAGTAAALTTQLPRPRRRRSPGSRTSPHPQRRAQVAKWVKTAALDAKDITEALEEALQLLEDPGTAYQLATPVTRRMYNQALFERLLILDDEVIDAIPARWVNALEDVAREAPTRQRGSEDPEWSLEQGPRSAGQGQRRARDNHGPGDRGHGLNVDQVVRRRGLEPPRGNPPTRPSTL